MTHSPDRCPTCGSDNPAVDRLSDGTTTPHVDHVGGVCWDEWHDHPTEADDRSPVVAYYEACAAAARIRELEVDLEES
jgi:hypothetical protein